MDGIRINGQIGKLWLCRKNDGHALGLLLDVQEDGIFFERLLLFREAVEPERIDQARPFVRVETTTLIPCSLCEAERIWWMGKGAKKRALKMYLAE